ncbi:hypothetical protein SAMN04487870_3380 [Pseudoalteromonas sp. DSM 26666]|jgi:hypothetical protein|uniref:hypothetical protein n=1 Tax=Pseudoalteromonas sp. DSM 26666 TaxID=1761892 RepID=UPI0008F14987|nr:hypothetical protein [Pseudoalteromonas sp. DSM 26666]SFU07500.1 hypothetical protein SAMN04487870_3380 [Pseudoalteromonas sp. DSM 26666]
MKIVFMEDSFYDNSIASETGSFAKWVKLQHPEIDIELPTDKNKVELHDYSLIMPIVNLAYAQNIPNYLALVLEYAKYRFAGSLKGEKNEINIQVDYEDKNKGITKRFSFKGSESALSKSVENFDINKFMDE